METREPVEPTRQIPRAELPWVAGVFSDPGYFLLKEISILWLDSVEKFVLPPTPLS